MATKIKFTDTELENAAAFAERICGDQPDNLGIARSPEERKRHSMVGRLGKIAFAKYLQSQEKDHSVKMDWEDMDSADQIFSTQTGATIDVRTASRSYHSRILVPQEEYDDNPKEEYYYVGVEIDIGNNEAEIKGYAYAGADEFYLFDGVNPPAYAVNLRHLHCIDELLSSEF